jgi:thiamine biosynthesis lipoprotein ApbE
MALAEIDRLEDALSLFRDRSEIARLNRDGRLVGPSGDLRRALALGLTVARSTGGPSIRRFRRCGRRMSTGSPHGLRPSFRPTR